MRILKLEFRNIGPFGNKLQTIDFFENGSLNVLLGKNGHGKSTVLNLPKLLFYGKIDKIKKEDISNRLNKNGYIRGIVEAANQQKYIIERSFSPSKLVVSIASDPPEEISKTGITDYQQFIENEIVGLPYNVYNNIVSLSVDDFKSFLTMSPSDKRNIIDKIFSIDIINKLYELVKYDIRDKKYNIDILDREIKYTEKIISDIEENIKKHTESKNSEIKIETEQLNESKDQINNKLVEIKGKQQVFESKVHEINTNLSKLKLKEGSIQSDIRNLTNQLNIFENNQQCPTCHTPFIDNSVINYSDIKNRLKNQIEVYQTNLKKVVDLHTKLKDQHTQVSKGLKICNEFISKSSNEIKNINEKINKLTKKSEDDSVNELSIVKTKSVDELNNKKKDKNILSDDINILDQLELLFSEEGLKKQIVQKYIPIINKDIDEMLISLRFPYSLKFDNDFKPIISHMGIEISADTLSTGEHKKVDLVTLISMIKILKIKYPNINIITLDELLSSIDEDSTPEIIKLLRSLSKELQINIYIVSHTSLPIEYFDRVISIEKSNGFSDLNIN